MDSKEYILSGILESYVLGVLTSEEAADVQKIAALHPEIKAELEAVQKAMNKYATGHSVTPPSYLKEKILAQITGETISAEPKVIPINRGRNYSYWSIAATVLLLICATFAFHFASQSNKMNERLDAMAKTNQAMEDSMKALAASYQQMQNDMAIMKDPSYKIVPLKGLKVSPDSKAMVCWSPTDKKVYIELDKMPAPPQGMQYQLWAIVDGKPVNEGMLTMGSGLHRMDDVANAQAFAITLEKQAVDG